MVYLAQDRDQWRALMNTVIIMPDKERVISGLPELLKKDSAPWSKLLS
jgi:hypothetical protein